MKNFTAGSIPFLFGVYPGGELGGETGLLRGKPDDPLKIEKALQSLEKNLRHPLIIRNYKKFCDFESPAEPGEPEGTDYIPFVDQNRRLDLVVMFQSERGNVSGYLDYIKDIIRQYGKLLYSLQITEEANFSDGPNIIDGPYPNVRQALVEGVITAKEELLRQSLDVQVGFNSTPTFGAAAEFWSSLKTLGGNDFAEAVDYAGLDFFPDVFRPVASDGKPGDLRQAVLGILSLMRHEWLPSAGLRASTRIHITEHGCPTSPDRSEIRQKEIIESVIRFVYESRELLNIVRYTLFALRDADSSQSNFFYQFGVLRDDYTPKPAFRAFQNLVSEFG
jgi:hypothetical protein